MKLSIRSGTLWLLAALPISVFSQEMDSQPFSGNAAISFASNYIWRGQKLSPKTVAQPTVGISYKGFNANLWTNYDNKFKETSETDLTVSYSFGLNMVAVDIGYINYAFDGFRDTQEFYGSLGFDVLLTPSVSLYYDFDEGEGAFLIASLAYSKGLSESISLELGVSTAVNFDNAIMGVNGRGDTFSGFYNANISASTTIPLFEVVSLAPYIAYSFPLSNDARTAIEAISFDGDSHIVYGGATLLLGF